MAPTSTRQWVLANKPFDMPALTGPKATFTLETVPLPELTRSQILVKVTHLSNDPAQRAWIDAAIAPDRLYRPPIDEGTKMDSRGIGEVVESKSEKFRVGDRVVGTFGWSEYVVLTEETKGLTVAKDLPGGLGPSHYLGALGGTGLTAYYGLVGVAEVKGGEKVLVSGAAGATGSMVVQIAKHLLGASEVIGIAGSDEKCRWVESLGADKCLNYKSSSFEEDLKAAAGKGFDVYFDNVGGNILDSALMHMKQGGRIAVCGAISSYNSGNSWTSKNWFQVITMRIQLRGFIVIDYLHRAAEAIEALKKGIQDGKLKVSEANETVVDTKFEDVPKTWLKLFEGGNTGKLITKLV